MTELEKEVMAHRYLYYTKYKPIISDYEYDVMEKKALKEVSESSPLNEAGSDLELSYSQEVKDLAMSWIR